MKKSFISIIGILVLLTLPLFGCQPGPNTRSATPGLRILAVESFLADITRQVAGSRAQVDALIPLGLDPHAFEPTPKDAALITASQVLVLNGHGLEDWLNPILQNADGQRSVIEASAGMQTRTPKAGEPLESDAHDHEGDPHFWLDPLSVVHYIEAIRDGLIAADPAGKDDYTRNAAAYIAELNALDSWIRAEVEQIPASRRLLITNHESFGYYADRYGFTISGTIVASVSSSASPSARQLAALVDHIRQSGAPAIFLETGTNPQMANQIASETNIKVVTGLYTHSVTPPDGEAPSYIAMLKANTRLIVDALR